jgi:RNase adaptor protein for sRNA GlmZ degradation
MFIMTHNDPAGTRPDAAPVTIISFGYGHGAPPEAHATFDVRHHFKDPHVDPALRHLTAADAQVMRAVLGTPGIPALAVAIVVAAQSFRAGPRPGPVTIAVGCVGGRHRSAGIAIEAARYLKSAGVPVTVTHRDMGCPVIARAAGGAR